MRIVLSVDVPLEIDSAYDANEICHDIRKMVEGYIVDTIEELNSLASSGEEDFDEVSTLVSEFGMMKESIQAIVWGTGTKLSVEDTKGK